MADAPSGTVTLLFTDIEGSTKLLQRAGDTYADLLDQHRVLLRSAFDANGGYEVDTEGDAFFVAFPSANDAVAAAAEAQQALARHEWPEDTEIRVRIGVHTGEPRLIEGKYVGLDVHRAARVMAASHGGQVVISHSTRDLLEEGFQLRDLGEHRLKDLSQPQRLYQLQVEGLPREFPALKTLENHPTNLPVLPTALIGRERELEEIELLLQREDVHLLTLTGPGGTGKTRLALQVAADLIEQFPSGVFFVSLAPISDPEFVVPAIARTLGLREQGGEPLLDRLNEYLREKQLLLLLDNFEQVVQAGPSVASPLASAPDLKLLVTSRSPLHLSGERSYEVPPLRLPDPGRLPEIEALAQYEAVRLFIERAHAVKPDFALTSNNGPAVAEICVRLDGLPLAIELAAARVRVLPPTSLLARLDERLKLLTGGARDMPSRHQTLRGAIDWSYSLLSEEEQRLFAYLSVFIGGCTLVAAEAVCDWEGKLGIHVLDGLTSLVEKSLLRQTEDATGEARLWMLETIREYASERLDEGTEAEALKRRHGEYFRFLGETAAAHLEGGEEQSAWLARLEREHANLRAALAFWRREPDSQLAIAAALHRFWWIHGHWREGRRWLEEALAASNQASPQRLKALEGAYYLAYLQEDTKCARTLLEEQLALARRLEDRESVAAALHGLASLALSEGDHERVAVLEEESLSFCEGEHFSTYPLTGLAWLAFFRSDFERARTLFQRAVEIGRMFKNDDEVASCLAFLATAAAFGGDEHEALTLLQESVLLGRKLGVPRSLALRSLSGFAALRCAQGDAEAAVRLLGASDALREEMGSPGGPVSRELGRRVLEAAQPELKEERIATVFAEGQSLTLDEALAYALGEKTVPSSPHDHHRAE
jgi:predicted ATPase/class 3 adenylate cyclase